MVSVFIGKRNTGLVNFTKVRRTAEFLARSPVVFRVTVPAGSRTAGGSAAVKGMTARTTILLSDFSVGPLSGAGETGPNGSEHPAAVWRMDNRLRETFGGRKLFVQQQTGGFQQSGSDVAAIHGRYGDVVGCGGIVDSDFQPVFTGFQQSGEVELPGGGHAQTCR